MPDLPPNFSEEVISTNNSSTANLGAGASFTGVSDQSIDYESITIILKSDQPCTVQLLQSTDNVNFDIVDTYTTSANVGDARTFDAVSSFAQVIVTNNGGSTTTFLRLQTVFSPTFCTTPRSLTQLGNFRVAVMESVPIGVSGTTAVSGGVSVLNFPVDQLIHGVVGVSGTSAVSGSVFILNFPVTQAVSGFVSILNFPPDQLIHGIVGVSGTTAVSGTVNIGNFPQIQGVSGGVTILNFPPDQLIHGIVGVSGTAGVSGSVSVLNFPDIQGVSGSITILNFPPDQLIHGIVGVSGITAVSGSVSILNFPLIQGVSGSVSILNFPADQLIHGVVGVSGITAVSGTINVGNFPAIQAVSGFVSVLNFPPDQLIHGIVGVSGTTAVSGTVNIGNFPVTQGVSGSITILNFPADQLIHGIVGVSGTAAVSGTVNVGNFPQTQGVSGSVSILNFPAIQAVSGTINQGTSPWLTKDAADGVSGQTVPGFAIQVAGGDSTGILRTIHTDVSGNVFVNVLGVSGTTAVSGSLSILNFPAIQGVSGGVTILNFPAIQGVSGTVNIGNFPTTQGVSGSVSILNFPAVQAVSGTINQGTNPWLTRDNADGISGTAGPLYSMQIAGADVSGILRTVHTDVSGNVFVNVLNFPTTQAVSGTIFVGGTTAVSGSITVLNFPVTQGVSGSVSLLGTSAVSGSVSISNCPTTQGISGSVTVLNFPITQGISGIVGVSGTTAVSGTINSRTDDGYGNPIASSGYGSLKVSDDGSPLFTDDFNGSSLDTNQWTSATSGVGAFSVSGSTVTLTSSTSGNASVRLSSIPTFNNQGISWIYQEVDLKVEAAILSNAYRFWGRGIDAVSGVVDGIGFEIDNSANLNAAVYQNGLKIFSQAVTKPVDGAYHRYFIFARTDTVNWYIDSVSGSVASANFQVPFTTALPVYLRLANNSTPPVSAPTFVVQVVGLSDSSVTNVQIIDSTYPWRKAQVSPNKELNTKDILNTTSQTQVINLVQNVPVEAKGGSSRLANRKVVVLSSVSGTYSWNFISGVSTSTGFPLFKNQIYPIAAGENNPVYIVTGVSGGIPVIVAEGS